MDYKAPLARNKKGRRRLLVSFLFYGPLILNK